jgi:hypothetical protein
MMNYILRNQLKKIALDRWENEGGKIPADQTETPEEVSSGKLTGEKKVRKFCGETVIGTPSEKSENIKRVGMEMDLLIFRASHG